MFFTNGEGANSSQDDGINASKRLPSFHTQRDLTLGGEQLEKLVARPNQSGSYKIDYTPNLNAVRNKNM